MPEAAVGLRTSAWYRGRPAPLEQVDGDTFVRWALRAEPEPVAHRPQVTLAPGARPILTQWWRPEVGWGIILPPPERRMSPADLSAGRDASEVIQRLIAKRFSAPGVPREQESTRAAVLRPLVGADQVMDLTRDGVTPLDIAGAPTGMADNAIPMYLLLCGAPSQLSWELQYVLGKRRLVGRLDLSDEGLARYVDALLTDWDGKANSPRSATVWSVVDDEDDEDDITRIMRDVIAEPVVEAMRGDPDGDVDVTFIDGTREKPATWAALTSSLAGTKPGVIVTTSHGIASREVGTLGLPIDQKGAAADPASLLNGQWSPNGSVWYAHACCSAGATGRSVYSGLFAAGTDNGDMLADVARAGPAVAPLPTALLSAPKPLRAFVGHVEPTFNYALRQPASGQSLTANLVAAIYPNLMRPEPIGHAFLDWQGQSSTYRAQYAHSQARFDRGELNAEEALLYYALCAADVGSMVILGDPAATLPPLR